MRTQSSKGLDASFLKGNLLGRIAREYSAHMQALT